MQTGESRKVLAVVEDLFFTVKIHDAAKRAGFKAEFVKSEIDALDQARQHPAVIILDLDKARLHDRPVDGAARRHIAARLMRSARKLDPRGDFLDSAALSILNFA